MIRLQLISAPVAPEGKHPRTSESGSGRPVDRIGEMRHFRWFLQFCKVKNHTVGIIRQDKFAESGIPPKCFFRIPADIQAPVCAELPVVLPRFRTSQSRTTKLFICLALQISALHKQTRPRRRILCSRNDITVLIGRIGGHDKGDLFQIVHALNTSGFLLCRIESGQKNSCKYCCYCNYDKQFYKGELPVFSPGVFSVDSCFGAIKRGH